MAIRLSKEQEELFKSYEDAFDDYVKKQRQLINSLSRNHNDEVKFERDFEKLKKLQKQLEIFSKTRADTNRQIFGK